MSRLENHAMLRDAASNVFNLQHFLGYCSHEGQIHSSGSSSVFAQHQPKGRKSRINFA